MATSEVTKAQSGPITHGTHASVCPSHRVSPRGRFSSAFPHVTGSSPGNPGGKQARPVLHTEDLQPFTPQQTHSLLKRAVSRGKGGQNCLATITSDGLSLPSVPVTSHPVQQSQWHSQEHMHSYNLGKATSAYTLSTPVCTAGR